MIFQKNVVLKRTSKENHHRNIESEAMFVPIVCASFVPVFIRQTLTLSSVTVYTQFFFTTKRRCWRHFYDIVCVYLLLLQAFSDRT